MAGGKKNTNANFPSPSSPTPTISSVLGGVLVRSITKTNGKRRGKNENGHAVHPRTPLKFESRAYDVYLLNIYVYVVYERTVVGTVIKSGAYL